MTARFPSVRVWIVFALACTILIAPLALQRVTAAASGPGIAVIGDSITARYTNDSGSDSQGWWSIVGRHYGSHVTTFAESGSGFVRAGHRCTGTRFVDRLSDVARSAPKVVIVEGGRNDWSFCTGNAVSETGNAMIKAAVDRFLTKLQRALPPHTTIFVLGPPWGSADAWQRSRVTSIIEASAKRHHVRFIDTQGVFDGGRTVDGIHPTSDGSVALGERVIKAIGPHLL